MRSLGGRLQCRDLRGQTVDRFGGGRVFLDNGVRGVPQLVDLRLQGLHLRQEVGVRFGRFGLNEDDFRFRGRRRYEGLNLPEAVALGLEFVGSRRRQRDFFFVPGKQIEDQTASQDESHHQKGEERGAALRGRALAPVALLESGQASFEIGVRIVAHEVPP